ncbi:uncharacterized protein G2W53_033573 [Senna tora]|uniref:Uncharacterized protein n=1 Tax=Senna tora TaxID=362788 RepID=A0A834T2G0_9FABA|nr:uncharacterized protein G2W53_033573 [Senna tora]
MKGKKTGRECYATVRCLATSAGDLAERR